MPRRRFIRRRRPLRRRGRRFRKRFDKMSKPQTLTLRSPGQIMPDRMKMKMVYIDKTRSTLNSVGSFSTSIRYRWNSLQDMDPNPGGSLPAGFTDMSGFYNYYRVFAAKIQVWFTNLDATTNPTVIIVPLNIDPGVSPTLNTVQSWQFNPYSRQAWMSGRGGMDRVKLSNYISAKKLVGSRIVMTDDQYTSQVGTIPAAQLWFAIGILASGGTAFTAGVSFQVKITAYCEFYERVVQIN